MKARLFIPLLLTCILAGCFPGGFKITRTENRENHPGGRLKTLEYIRTTRYNSSDIFSFYQAVRTVKLEFNTDSVLVRQTEQKTTRGEGGSGCYLVKYRSREYYPDGKIKKETRVRCDGKKTITRFYSSDGKLNFVRIERRILK